MDLTIATLILAVFAAGSAVAASWTAWETQRLRKDSQRPLLVPDGGTRGVAQLNAVPILFTSDVGWLHVRNIGLGPAENIAIRLELRIEGVAPKVQLDEMQNAVEPLASGREALCYQWQNSEKSVEIYDDHWVVISYDDMFHRHFETEARRIKDSDNWVSVRTKLVRKPRPHVRESDYYKDAFGRDDNQQ